VEFTIFNIENCYIAGVIAAGNDANTIFIENGKFHGGIIAQSFSIKMVFASFPAAITPAM
jgi:thioredoxin reductase